MKVHNYNLNAGNHVNVYCDLQCACQEMNRIMRYSSSVDFVVIQSPVMDT